LSRPKLRQAVTRPVQLVITAGETVQERFSTSPIANRTGSRSHV
jgi:hypothetical protein